MGEGRDASPPDGDADASDASDADGDATASRAPREAEGQPKSSGYPGAADEWDEMLLCPLEIRFTQDNIHPFFYRRGPIVHVLPKIRSVALSDGTWELLPPFGPIHCLRRGGRLWSMDNRRLYALQLCAMDFWPRQVRVKCLVRERLPRHKFKTQYRKFNTTSEGRTIGLSTRYQHFETWNWHEKALEMEGSTFSQRLGMVLTVFEALPVLGALLFRSGWTGLSSRAPLLLSFVVAFALDFLRQRYPKLFHTLSRMQVKAVMEGEGLMVALGQDEDSPGMCKSQLAALMALVLVLSLPCMFGIAHAKVRSSLFSCWLGVAFMLLIQLSFSFRWSDEDGLPTETAEEQPTVEDEAPSEVQET
ncbi:unnamed protein product [Durusdinium trenchii]|uniref:Uncharacterized protein n=2 Tax=Durusdinium trenchii TaxID=1381693 RepID=A0ABP0RE47_9DINO